MEPLNDKELKSLLDQWKAPATPHSLSRAVLPRPQSWWAWLTTGTIRIPVPVGIAAFAILALWLIFAKQTPPPVTPPVAETTTLADFQPVQQLEPRVIEVNHENNTTHPK
jgi:hypothetical protein